MALNDVTTVLLQNQVGRALPGQDFVSGMLLFTNSLPSGFSSGSRVKQVLSVAQAEALGILGDYSDATAATGTVTANATLGNTGDTITCTIADSTGTVTLCTYTKAATDTTTTLVATGIKNAINLLTPVHGYSATSSVAIVTVTAPKKQGVFVNTVSIVATVTGTIGSPTIAAFSGGVASILKQFHYHITEYFRMNPTGNLWLYIAPITSNAWDFAELQTLQNTASGTIRQVGIYLANTANFANAAAIATAANSAQTQLNILNTAHFPMSAVIGTDLKAITDFTTLTNLRTLTNRQVSVTIGQDGANLGSQLAKQNYSITNLGAVLGAVSYSAVNEDIAWIQKFNFSNGTENAVPAYSNGTLVNMITDTNLLTQLDTYGYIFMRYYSGVAGTYVNDNHCCITSSSDNAFINDNRTMDKAARLVYAGVLPALAGPLTLNSNGTLANTTITYYRDLADAALDAMVRNQEISDKKVTIDPAQNVLTTSKLVIGVSILARGVARKIEVDLGYVKSLS
jgi:Protein of unknown function (DUF2586)